MKNIFTYFLSLLKVKHTKTFSNNYFEEHPHKYNLFGLSKMLTDYKVENLGIKVKDKNDILELETPFIAHTGVDFVVVEKITASKVNYIWSGKKLNLALDDFKSMWTGVALLAESNLDSAEPNYKSNIKVELFQNVKQYLLLGSLFLIIGLAFFSNASHNYMPLLISLIIKKLSKLKLSEKVDTLNDYEMRMIFGSSGEGGHCGKVGEGCFEIIERENGESVIKFGKCDGTKCILD